MSDEAPQKRRSRLQPSGLEAGGESWTRRSPLVAPGGALDRAAARDLGRLWTRNLLWAQARAAGIAAGDVPCSAWDVRPPLALARGEAALAQLIRSLAGLPTMEPDTLRWMARAEQGLSETLRSRLEEQAQPAGGWRMWRVFCSPGAYADSGNRPGALGPLNDPLLEIARLVMPASRETVTMLPGRLRPVIYLYTPRSDQWKRLNLQDQRDRNFAVNCIGLRLIKAASLTKRDLRRGVWPDEQDEQAVARRELSTDDERAMLEIGGSLVRQALMGVSKTSLVGVEVAGVSGLRLLRSAPDTLALPGAIVPVTYRAFQVSDITASAASALTLVPVRVGANRDELWRRLETLPCYVWNTAELNWEATTFGGLGEALENARDAALGQAVSDARDDAGAQAGSTPRAVTIPAGQVVTFESLEIAILGDIPVTPDRYARADGEGENAPDGLTGKAALDALWDEQDVALDGGWRVEFTRTAVYEAGMRYPEILESDGAILEATPTPPAVSNKERARGYRLWNVELVRDRDEQMVDARRLMLLSVNVVTPPNSGDAVYVFDPRERRLWATCAWRDVGPLLRTRVLWEADDAKDQTSDDMTGLGALQALWESRRMILPDTIRIEIEFLPTTLASKVFPSATDVLPTTALDFTGGPQLLEPDEGAFARGYRFAVAVLARTAVGSDQGTTERRPLLLMFTSASGKPAADAVVYAYSPIGPQRWVTYRWAELGAEMERSFLQALARPWRTPEFNRSPAVWTGGDDGPGTEATITYQDADATSKPVAGSLVDRNRRYTVTTEFVDGNGNVFNSPYGTLVPQSPPVYPGGPGLVRAPLAQEESAPDAPPLEITWQEPSSDTAGLLEADYSYINMGIVPRIDLDQLGATRAKESERSDDTASAGGTVLSRLYRWSLDASRLEPINGARVELAFRYVTPELASRLFPDSPPTAEFMAGGKPYTLVCAFLRPEGAQPVEPVALLYYSDSAADDMYVLSDKAWGAFRGQGDAFYRFKQLVSASWKRMTSNVSLSATATLTELLTFARRASLVSPKLRDQVMRAVREVYDVAENASSTEREELQAALRRYTAGALYRLTRPMSTASRGACAALVERIARDGMGAQLRTDEGQLFSITDLGQTLVANSIQRYPYGPLAECIAYRIAWGDREALVRIPAQWALEIAADSTIMLRYPTRDGPCVWIEEDRLPLRGAQPAWGGLRNRLRYQSASPVLLRDTGAGDDDLSMLATANVDQVAGFDDLPF